MSKTPLPTPEEVADNPRFPHDDLYREIRDVHGKQPAEWVWTQALQLKSRADAVAGAW